MADGAGAAATEGVGRWPGRCSSCLLLRHTCTAARCQAEGTSGHAFEAGQAQMGGACRVSLLLDGAEGSRALSACTHAQVRCQQLERGAARRSEQAAVHSLELTGLQDRQLRAAQEQLQVSW